MINAVVLSFLFLTGYSRIGDSVANFAFYLGDKNISYLKEFDLVIVSPNLKSSHIRNLHEHGTTVIASVQLVDSFDIYRLLLERGFDGFFFELSGLEDVETKVRAVRDSFPSSVIVVHPEISQIESVARYVDGIVWIGLSTACNSDDCYVIRDDFARGYKDYIALNLVKRLELFYRFKVLSLDMLSAPNLDDVSFCYRRAMSYGFIPYVATPTLDAVVWPPHLATARSVVSWKSKMDPNFKLPSQIKRVTTSANIALAMNGAKIIVDSNLDGADPSIVNDGYRNDPGISWLVKTWWASASSEDEHYVIVKLPQEVYLDSIKVYWPIVDGVPMSPQWYRIEARSSERDFWWPIITADGGALRRLDKFFFTDALASEVRVVIKPGTGPKLTPNQLWVSEVEVYGRP